MIIIHDDIPVKSTCIHCKKPLPLLKCFSRKIGENISEIMLDSHKHCAKQALELEYLADQIEEQDKILRMLRMRYATLKTLREPTVLL